MRNWHSMLVAGLLSFGLLPVVANATILTEDTVWKGEVVLSEDLLIPVGKKLTISPGTIVTVIPGESTKTDPEFSAFSTEIMVRGELKCEGGSAKDMAVSFVLSGKAAGDDAWGGIMVDGGIASFKSTTIGGAEAAVTVVSGQVNLNKCRLSGNKYGLVAVGEKAAAELQDTTITDNDYGLLSLKKAKVSQKSASVSGNRKKDTITTSKTPAGRPQRKEYLAQGQQAIRTYADESLVNDTTVWDGRIVITGVVRVPEGRRLIILPGTVVEFTKNDTNGDDIGENGLLLQGLLIAKGTSEKPILFRSGESNPKAGDWDAINIVGVDSVQSLVEYCQIENAYRGVHFHFSNVAVGNSIFRNNYRAIQFQESVVSIMGCQMYDNKSALRARDSDIEFINNEVFDNQTGASLFRTNVQVQENKFAGNGEDGLRVREGVTLIERNSMVGNRYGLLVANATYGKFNQNTIAGNDEVGILLKNNDNIEIAENVIQYNLVNGINIQSSSGLIHKNLIANNAIRGIGVESFDGVIAENDIVDNGLYALEVEGASDVSAPSNWWGRGKPEDVIFDHADDPAKGTLKITPVRNEPVRFTWFQSRISTDVVWQGEVAVLTSVEVPAGVTLTIAPGTRVLFAKDVSVHVLGKIVAVGTEKDLITFTSASHADVPGWGEIYVERAADSVFQYCLFENATWALHSHYCNLKVSDSFFLNNYGGLRFRSGPVFVTRSRFSGNSIAIRAYLANAAFTENIFTENDIAIFVRGGASGLTINRNNIFANESYSIRMGDFNTEDVDAKDNWWGPEGPGTGVFDDKHEPGIGKVILVPFAKSAFDYSSIDLKKRLSVIPLGPAGSKRKFPAAVDTLDH